LSARSVGCRCHAMCPFGWLACPGVTPTIDWVLCKTQQLASNETIATDM
jgi:hypothetical protein